METVGLGLYFEDMPMGRQFQTIGRTVTDADITNFINCTGMIEILFTNLEYLDKETDFEGRLAPGALVYCFAEALVMAATLQKTGMAFLGCELNIHGPTYAGDTIHVECEVVEHRHAKKGARGLVRTENKVINQKGEVVLTYNPIRMAKAHS